MSQRLKIFKGLGFIFLAVLFLLGLVACDDTMKIELKNPQITDEGVLKWDSLSEVSKYIITVGDQEYEVTANEFDLAALTLENGTYSIKIKAVLKDGKTTKEVTLTYERNISSSTNKLTTPANLRIADGKLMWSSVANVTSYEIKIGDVIKTSATNEISLSELNLAKGRIQITIKAKGASAEFDSEYSIAFNYLNDYTTEELTNLIKAKYLEANPNTDPELLDRETQYIFDYFVEQLRQDTNVLNIQILEFIETFFMDDDKYEDPLEGTLALIEYFVENAEFSDEQIVAIIYNYLRTDYTSGSSNKEYYEQEIVDLQNQLIEYQTEYEAKQELVNSLSVIINQIDDLYQDLYALYGMGPSIEALYNSLGLEIDSEIFKRNYYTYEYYLKEEDIEGKNDLESQYPWLLDCYDFYLASIAHQESITTIENQINNLTEANPKAQIDYYEAQNKLEYLKNNIKDLNNDISDYQQRIEEIEKPDEINTLISEYVITNEQKVKNAIIPLYKLVKNAYKDVFEMIMEIESATDLTPAEIATLKNEFINIIFDQANIPTEAEFTNITVVLKDLSVIIFEQSIREDVVGEEKTAFINTIYNTYDLIAEIYYPTVLVYKEFLLAITAEDIESIMGSPNYSYNNALVGIILKIGNDRLANNQVYLDNSQIIKEKLDAFILANKIEALPYLVQRVFAIELEDAQAIVDQLLNNYNIINDALLELEEILEKSGFLEFVLNQYENPNVLASINIDYLASLKEEDISNIIKLLKTSFVTYYELFVYNAEEQMVTPEQLKAAINEEEIKELLVLAVNLSGKAIEKTNEVITEDLFKEDLYGDALVVLKALGNLYKNDLQAKTTRIQELLVNILNNETIAELFVQMNLDLPEFNGIAEAIDNLFANVDLLANLEAANLTEEEKAEINSIIKQIPFISDLFRDQVRPIIDSKANEMAMLFVAKFNELKDQGKEVGDESNETTFTINEIIQVLNWEEYVIDVSSNYGYVYVKLELYIDGFQVMLHFEGSSNIYYYFNIY